MAIRLKTTEGTITLEGRGSLLQLCIANKIDINHVCGGGASCGTCQIMVMDGLETLPPRNELEQDMADDRNFLDNERLACQLDVTPDLDFSFIIPFTLED